MMSFLISMLFILFFNNYLINKYKLVFFYNYFFMMSLMFMIKFNKIELNLLLIYNNFMIDKYSYGMILLSFWIISLMFMSSKFIFNKNIYFMFVILMILLMISLYLCFSSMNYMLFYFFFEMSLIPMMFLILGFGNYPERLQASMYMLFYTLFMSLPLMMIIFYLYKKLNTLMMLFLLNNIILIKSFIIKLIFYMYMILTFLVKLPIYFLHLWLPKAHVEAPIFGSMILAGIMLKLGGYGLLRSLMMMMNISKIFNIIFMILSLFGSMYLSLMCLIQIDLKMLVAYSSIVHMGLMISSIMTMTEWSFIGSYLMMISHGLCSSSLFCLVNFNYEFIKSRSFMINKGLMNLMPNMNLLWFISCLSNFSAPPSLNLLSEIMMINSLIFYSLKFMWLIILISMFSTLYSIYLYSFTQHGKLIMLINKISLNNMNQFLMILFHWIPLNLIIINLMIFFI